MITVTSKYTNIFILCTVEKRKWTKVGTVRKKRIYLIILLFIKLKGAFTLSTTVLWTIMLIK